MNEGLTQSTRCPDNQDDSFFRSVLRTRHSLDDPELFSYFLQQDKQQLNLFVRMGCHETDSKTACPVRNRRWTNGRDVDAVVEQFLRKGKCSFRLPDEDRDNRCFASTGVESGLREMLPDLGRDLPETFSAFQIASDQIHCGNGSR